MLKKLLGYAAYMFGANTFTALLNFGVTALGMATRPKEAVGDYALYMLIYSVGNGVLIFGANAAIQRYSADDDENRKRFAKLFYIVFLLLFAIASVAAYGLWRFVGLNVALAGLGLPWVATYWYGRYLMRSRLDAKREARLMMVASLSNTIFQFLFLTFTDLRDALIYGDFLALVAGGLLALLMVPSGLGLKLAEIKSTIVPRAFVREILGFSASLWLSGQVYSAKAQLQAGWTGARIGAQGMASIQSLSTMWQFVAKPIEYLGQAALPGLVSAKESRDELYRELLRFCLVVVPVIGIGACAGIPLIFRIIDFAYLHMGGAGLPLIEKYAEVPVLMMLSTLALAMMALELVTNQYSVAVGRPRNVFYAQIANVIVMVVTLVPLSEHYGLYGVVLTGSIGELANGLTFVIALYKDHRQSMKLALRWSLLASAATVPALLPIYWQLEHPLGWLMVVPALLIYGLLMLLAGMVSWSDVGRIKRSIFGGSAAPGPIQG